MEQQDEPEMVFEAKSRYLSLHGSYIDQLGNQTTEHVTSEMIQNRITRDQGSGHHITVVNHLDMRYLMPPPTEEEESNRKKARKHTRDALKHVRDTMINEFGQASEWERPVDLGLGSTEEGEAVTYYRVLHWPWGQRMRGFLGLGHGHFHITVGFKPRDVHLYKGPATLLCLRKGAVCTTPQIQSLVQYAPFYYGDDVFIKNLIRTCVRHGHYGSGARLSAGYLYCKNQREAHHYNHD
ncbi:hypothetical protein INT47_008566 [Mucor saturninus]|uniref:Swiss Army Knife 2H phosphoesterase domain-containing protein n=1 Tax=Mucor saturninus TaxID=64648 RepID=A0A8H7R8D8_9FUNG|nr:hypothetical protein INT47_008566 [Mucor saturninus]